jgi:hypothetical protein
MSKGTFGCIHAYAFPTTPHFFFIFHFFIFIPNQQSSVHLAVTIENHMVERFDYVYIKRELTSKHRRWDTFEGTQEVKDAKCKRVQISKPAMLFLAGLIPDA